MKNPWIQNRIELARDVLRFSLWFCIFIKGLLLALFSIAFVACFVWNGWHWCWRTLFRDPW